MEAIRFILLSGLALFAFGCAQSKTSSSVFPGTQGLSASCEQQALPNQFIVQWEDGRFTVESDDDSAEHFRKSFVEKNLEKIKHVDHDFIVQIKNNDTTALQQFATQDADPSGGWGPEQMKASALWAQDLHGDGVLVGVIDGMVDVTHQQLQPNIAINTNEIENNGIDDDNNGYVDDVYGIKLTDRENDPTQNTHGSHVAGIIAADPSKGDPLKGIVHGVADRAKIIPAQFIENNGSGNISSAILAINYVVKRGAKIINLSWGAGTCADIPTLKATLQKVSEQGVLIVTAAGNGDDNYHIGLNTDVYPTIPGSYNLSTQINVAASTYDDYLTSFTNFGLKTVHVAAPGSNILSTIPGNKVVTESGTSMASPMVAGAAALLWGAFPSATALQIKQALLSSVDIIAGHPFEVSSRGRINIEKAYAQLQKSLTP